MNKITLADLENLWSEVKLHQQLKHQNIIEFYDCVQSKNHLYFLLEYASNGCLFYYIHARDGLPEHLAIRFLYQTSLAVKLLHDKKLIHRDIKPENIVFDKKFNVKLCDFGWSCFLSDGYRTSVCGTFEYMSPEIVRDRCHTNKVDIWCLGILLYEMLHGNPPYKGQSLSALAREFQYQQIMINSNISSQTKNLLQNLLQQNPKKRFNINQLLKHEVFEHFKEHLTRPLTSQEIKLMVKVFISNSGGAQKKNLPEAVKLYLHNKKKNQLKKQNFNKKVNSNQTKKIKYQDYKNQSSKKKEIEKINKIIKPKEFNNKFVNQIKQEPNLYASTNYSNNQNSNQDKNFYSSTLNQFQTQSKKLDYFLNNSLVKQQQIQPELNKVDIQGYKGQYSQRTINVNQYSSFKQQTNKNYFQDKYLSPKQPVISKFQLDQNNLQTSQTFQNDNQKLQQNQIEFKKEDSTQDMNNNKIIENQTQKFKQFSSQRQIPKINIQKQVQNQFPVYGLDYNSTQKQDNKNENNYSNKKEENQNSNFDQKLKSYLQKQQDSQQLIKNSDLHKKQQSSILQLNLNNLSQKNIQPPQSYSSQRNIQTTKNFSSQRNIPIASNLFKQQQKNEIQKQVKQKLKNPLKFRMVNSERRISQPILQPHKNISQFQQSEIQKNQQPQTKPSNFNTQQLERKLSNFNLQQSEIQQSNQESQQLERKQSNFSLSDYKYTSQNGVLVKQKMSKEDIQFHTNALIKKNDSQILQNQQNTQNQNESNLYQKNYSLYEDILIPKTNQNEKKSTEQLPRKRVVSQRTISLERYDLLNLKKNQDQIQQNNNSFRNLYQSINFQSKQNENQNQDYKNYSFHNRNYN